MSVRTGALRRRRKPSLATRLRIAWVFIVATVAAIAYAGYVLVTLPQLRVHSIDVRIAGLSVRESDVRVAANIDRRSNVWLLDTTQIARRVEAIPYVDRAEIERTPPAGLAIVVTEREPVACVRSGARLVTIDRTQRILQTGCARESALHIVLRNGSLGAPGSYAAPPALAGLLADGRTFDDAHLGVRSIAEDAFGQVVAVNARGIMLLFGSDSDLAEEAKLVAPVLAAVQPGHVIRSLDLRAPATPTVEYR